ncbi:imidazole glycerol phosphate synthase subunit HisH [Tardibacter chloracetimidivorans]|uniref:Imidazole glycerol phosphate synthase subunit HisH n=1 Tax=Tardibacter chloracetimidivorans TaxID=1921510 RepID=A0A1L3ZU12_9SPHN|nr:imidazole glycerol phosphate synthase subunit HisH [Tardibacter chloracetimidivorans]API59080.1 imidazole glycerol phosphate synthase subunit HisH [Tardibacter chloracetimidivorans]
MAEKIAIVDYGAGNLRSVANALAVAAGTRAVNVVTTGAPEDVRTADRVILPGVGAFGQCAAALRALPGMEDALEEAVVRKGRPFLGICVGMQLMADSGQEHGVHKGLGWIGGDVVRLQPADMGLKIPHMGWNRVEPATAPSPIEPGEAYFVHSYHFRVADPAHLAATTDYGQRITAAVARDNLLGVQFHPEKSQRYGLALLERFLDWNP